jgi:hypothetical protein
MEASVAACVASHMAHPGETALHNPSFWRKHKAPAGLRPRNDHYTGAVVLPCYRCVLTSVADIRIERLNGPTGDVLDPFGQGAVIP